MAAGRGGKLAVLVSLVITQFAVNVAYMIFILQMAQSLAKLGWHHKPPSLDSLVVAGLVVVLIPLCLIRSVRSLEYPILVSDALIFFGLGVIIYCNLSTILGGGSKPELSSFRPSSCSLFIGTALYAFEGIPTILPICNSMREPARFRQTFMVVFAGIIVLFMLVGLAGYVAYGTDVEPAILLNLPQRDALIITVKAGYSLALVLGSPLVFLPAARVTELWAFGVVERGRRKWAKNAMRTVEVCLFGLATLYGVSYFEEFLAFACPLCCAPIAFIYPAFFHLRLCASTYAEKMLDLFFIALGMASMVFVLAQTIHSL